MLRSLTVGVLVTSLLIGVAGGGSMVITPH